MNVDSEYIANEILNNDDFIIYTHSKPDGDTLGSAYALNTALKLLGKESYIVVQDPIPYNLKEYFEV